MQLSRPEMGTATSFHADQAGLQIGKERCHLLPSHLLLQYRVATPIDAMDLNDVLCQVDAYRGNLHFGRLSRSVGISIRHFGTSDAVSSRGDHPINLDPLLTYQ